MKNFLLFLFVIAVLSSCKILAPSIMLKTPKNYQYAKIDSVYKSSEYKLAPNDIIEFRVYSNGGFRLTDIVTQQPGLGTAGAASSFAGATTNSTTVSSSTSFPIDYQGNVKLPVLGKTYLANLTIREAEKFLEEKYSLYYNSPFVVLRVLSNRVFIFPGMAGSARVVPLVYQNTTLMEALASSGGIAFDGKAYEIKLIRKNGSDNNVYHIDLSTIEGLRMANIVLQGGDIIYVEPRIRFAQLISNELAPIITILSTLALIGTTILLLK